MYGEGDIDINDLFDINTVDENLDGEIDDDEITKAVKFLKCGKSSGIDGILNEFIICTLGSHVACI